MSNLPSNENIDIEQRKKQALELNISLNEEMTIECIEKEIVESLENGMKDLKNILDEISHLDS